MSEPRAGGARAGASPRGVLVVTGFFFSCDSCIFVVEFFLQHSDDILTGISTPYFLTTLGERKCSN